MKMIVCKPVVIICWILLSVLLITNTYCNKSISPSNSDSIITRKDSLSFIVIGDWGVAGAEAQKPVAGQMDVYAKKHNVKFIIAAGDNFYPSGVSGISDVHWQISFEEIYNKEGHQVPWYVVLGNHDYQSNPQAQINYSVISSRWKMPSRYYTVKKNIDASHSVLFAFTDTSPFITAYYGMTMADLQQQDTASQLLWLRSTLAASNDTWKIVIGHHPLYSAGLHGNAAELIARFKPSFLQTQTNFYISGHDHNLQHITQPNEPVQYLVSGAAGYSATYPVTPNANTVFAKSSPGFLVMVLYSGYANFYFYDQLGTLLHSKQIVK